MLCIVESKRHKPILLLDNYRYPQNKILNTTIYWKCEHHSCPGRVIQYESNPSCLKKSHNHDDDDEMKCKVQEFKMNLKRPIFWTLESLKHLSQSVNDHLFFDATFKSCPNPFFQ
jgi:hypothetical protein